MKRALAVLLIAQLASVGGCGFAVKHPAAAAAIFGATVGFSTCELGGASEHKSCAEVAGGAGALLGLTVLAALWLGTTDDPNAPSGYADDENERPATPKPFVPRAQLPEPAVKPVPAPVIPDYLKTTPAEVYARQGGNIVRAPAEDQAVAATFAASPVRGTLVDGQRITILTAKTKYAVGEEVRVIHILDAPEPGHDVFVMGPKEIFGESVDGVERTRANPGLQPYDGRVVPSPAVDYNYEVTTYKFDTPGIHLIQWKVGKLASNVIAVDVK